MMRRTGAAALALTALAGAGMADGTVLAEVYSNNGSLPPPYHQHMRLTIAEDGTVTLRACEGYGDDACITRRGIAPPPALDAIRAAAAASGLAERPAVDDPAPHVGGSSTSGYVILGGQRIVLPAFPVTDDHGRVRAVMSAVMAAVPAEMPHADLP
ncbi:MAG TPA: hypothetical protein PKD10_00630 [Paracoccaceae bacterium]|nr:hypothetical protein [Paracoccaceae bacterium]HMO73098.1 hypothetical protein [Paracoccaceae bacterium]